MQANEDSPPVEMQHLSVEVDDTFKGMLAQSAKRLRAMDDKDLETAIAFTAANLTAGIQELERRKQAKAEPNVGSRSIN